MLTDLDRRAVARGAAAALVLGAPAAVASSLLADRKESYSGALTALSLVLLLAFAIGGFVAGRESPTLPAKHAAAAALAGFGVVQALGILARASRGAPISVTNIAFTALLAASAGMVGGLLAAHRSRVAS